MEEVGDEWTRQRAAEAADFKFFKRSIIEGKEESTVRAKLGTRIKYFSNP